MTAEERLQWLEARRSGVGGSDIAAVCGFSPFGQTAFDVYCQKAGLVLLVDRFPNQAMRWGHLLEPVVAAAYAELSGCEVVLADPPLVRHPHYEWCLASPDRRIPASGKLLECKTARTAEGWGEEGTSQVPYHYYLQVQWQLLADQNAQGADLAVLIAGQEVRVYPIEPSPEVQEMLLHIAGDFWARVRARRPPPLDFRHPQAVRLAGYAYRPTPGKSIPLDDGAVDLVLAWEQSSDTLKRMQAQNYELKARLIAALGDAECGLLGDGRVVKKKLVRLPTKEITYTRPENEYVLLTIQNAKEEAQT